MMTFVCDTREQAEIMRRLLAAASHRLGGQAPPWLSDVRFAVIGDHRPSSAITAVDGVGDVAHDALVTFSEAVKMTGLSKSTLRRRANAGELVRVGRRLSAASVRAFAAGGR